MPWCPKCETEYREGIFTCTDCGSTLVEELNSSKNNDDTIMEPTFLSPAETEVNDMSEEEAIVFLEETKREALERRKRLEEGPGLYVESSKKAQDFKSGGLSLLFVGGLGFICVLLILLGIIPLHMNIFSKYLITGVMGTMFLLFIIMGFLSVKSYKKFEIKASEEDTLTQNLTSWVKDNLQKDIIDADLEGSSEELLYFLRTEKMKEMIMQKYMNLDAAFLDSFIDDIYPSIFG